MERFLRFISLIFLAILSSSSAFADQLDAYARYQIDHPTLQDVDQDTQIELKCMALNIYHEARGAGRKIQERVAWVTRNRLESDIHGNTICEVVFEKYKNHAQWSWTTRRMQPKFEPKSWHLAQEIAYLVYYGEISDPSAGSRKFMEHNTKPRNTTSAAKSVMLTRP